MSDNGHENLDDLLHEDGNVLGDYSLMQENSDWHIHVIRRKPHHYD